MFIFHNIIGILYYCITKKQPKITGSIGIITGLLFPENKERLYKYDETARKEIRKNIY